MCYIYMYVCILWTDVSVWRTDRRTLWLLPPSSSTTIWLYALCHVLIAIFPTTHMMCKFKKSMYYRELFRAFPILWYISGSTLFWCCHIVRCVKCLWYLTELLQCWFLCWTYHCHCFRYWSFCWKYHWQHFQYWSVF